MRAGYSVAMVVVFPNATIGRYPASMFSFDYTKEIGLKDRHPVVSPRVIALLLLLAVIGAMWVARGHVARDTGHIQRGPENQPDRAETHR